ncbi:MAG TPA: hypothetical protein VH518_25435 [Tepidisphaeraceae bacterium]|jgi:excisionase family DNA binding protein
MPDHWMSVAEAATLLKVHTRTIERRIASGKLQTRRTDDGLLQVQIDVPDTASAVPDTALETVRELAADQVSLATGSASALVKFARDDAQRSREELVQVRLDAGRARRSALAAWLVVASMAIGVTIAVGWTASKITRANSDVRQLTDYASKMEEASRKLVTERDNARQEARQADLDRAEASGKLAVYVEQMNRSTTQPTTRPTSLIGRLAAAFSQD